MSAQPKINRNRMDPSAGGFYTVQEAARLLNIAQPSRVTAWLEGHKRSSLGPVVRRQYSPIDAIQELGFLDLLEVRFIDHFRTQGVSLQALRKAAETARVAWKQRHPFALSNTQYLTDRKAVFQATATALNDTVLLNLVTRQYAMYVVYEDHLARGVAFDPSSGLAREWHPRPKEFPNLALNPLIAGGQPAVMPAGVPTAAIFRTWKSEDGSYNAVSDWYNVDEDLVREAIEFEIGLPN